MPYLEPKEANNRLIDSLADIKTRNGPPPWREPVLATERFRMVLLCWPPGYHHPRHYHPRADESWLIYEGQVRVIFDDGTTVVADPGSVLFAKKGTVHDMTVTSKESLLLVAIVAPNEPDDEVKLPLEEE